MRLLLLGLCSAVLLTNGLPSLGQTVGGVKTTSSAPAALAPLVRPDRKSSNAGVEHPTLDKAWNEYAVTTKKAIEGVRAAISKQMDVAIDEGNLDAALYWQSAEKDFAARLKLPDAAIIQNEVKAAKDAFGDAEDALKTAYQEVEKTLVKERKIAEAKAARNEWAWVALSIVGKWQYLVKGNHIADIEVYADGTVSWFDRKARTFFSKHWSKHSSRDGVTFLISDVQGEKGREGWHVVHLLSPKKDAVCDDWYQGPGGATLKPVP